MSAVVANTLTGDPVISSTEYNCTSTIDEVTFTEDRDSARTSWVSEYSPGPQDASVSRTRKVMAPRTDAFIATISLEPLRTAAVRLVVPSNIAGPYGDDVELTVWLGERVAESDCEGVAEKDAD